MIGLFGLCDHSVHDAHRILEGSGLRVGLLLPDTDLTQLDVVLIVSAGKFIARADMLSDWEGICIVFDSPVRCDSLVGITLLDVRERSASFRYIFDRITPEFLLAQIKAAKQTYEEVVFHSRTANLLPYLLNQTSSSQMDRLQTWKYSIKNVELRDEALTCLISWFFVEKPTVDALKKRLMTLLSLDKSKALNILFQDSKFPELKTAVLEVKKFKDDEKSYSVDKIAEKHGVSAFDIRYLISVFAKRKKTFVSEAGVKLEDIQRAARLKQRCPLTGLMPLDEKPKVALKSTNLKAPEQVFDKEATDDFNSDFS